MGLLGLFKAHHEAVTASVREWLGKEYIKDVLGGTALYALEEFTTEFITDVAGLTGWKRGLVKNVGRLVFSAIYYYGLGRWAPGVALISSMLPIVTMVADGIAWLIAMVFKVPARRFDDYGAVAAQIVLAKLGGISSEYGGVEETEVASVSLAGAGSSEATEEKGVATAAVASGRVL